MRVFSVALLGIFILMGIGFYLQNVLIAENEGCAENRPSGATPLASRPIPNAPVYDDRREFLVSKGFRCDPESSYTIKNIAIGVILSRLGLNPEEMKPTVSQERCSDIRQVEKSGIYYIFRSHKTGKDGLIISNSLNDSDCPCDVSASFIDAANREYQRKTVNNGKHSK